jgi:hypothetical protein
MAHEFAPSADELQSNVTFLLTVCSNSKSLIVFPEEEDDQGHGKVSVASKILEILSILRRHFHRRHLPDDFDSKGRGGVRAIF